MYGVIKEYLNQEIEKIKDAGLFKEERIITSAQGPEITLNTGEKVLNFCANNYLGLSSHPEVVKAAQDTMDTHGFGMSSVRFICGTQDIHKQLEQKIAEFYQTEDTILYAAAFDANGGVFEPLFGEKDAIISDSLNHASIIDGVRLTKSMRYRYEHNSMEDLEAKLKEAIAIYEDALNRFNNNELSKLSEFDIIENCLKPLGNLYTKTGDYTNALSTINQYIFLALKSFQT